jgi:hypothetical protein
MLGRFFRQISRSSSTVTIHKSSRAATSATYKRSSVKKTFIVSPRPDLIYLPGAASKIDDVAKDIPKALPPLLTQTEMNLLDEAEFFAKAYPNTIQFLQVGGFYELFDLSVHDLEDLSRYFDIFTCKVYWVLQLRIRNHEEVSQGGSVGFHCIP